MSPSESPKELGWVHSVLEGLPSVDEDYGNFFVVLLPEFGVLIDVDFAPGEVVTRLEFCKLLFDDFAEVAAIARVDENFVH